MAWRNNVEHWQDQRERARSQKLDMLALTGLMAALCLVLTWGFFSQVDNQPTDDGRLFTAFSAFLFLFVSLVFMAGFGATLHFMRCDRRIYDRLIEQAMLDEQDES